MQLVPGGGVVPNLTATGPGSLASRVQAAGHHEAAAASCRASATPRGRLGLAQPGAAPPAERVPSDPGVAAIKSPRYRGHPKTERVADRLAAAEHRAVQLALRNQELSREVERYEALAAEAAQPKGAPASTPPAASAGSGTRRGSPESEEHWQMVWASTARDCRAPRRGGGPGSPPPGRSPDSSGAAASLDAGQAPCGDDGRAGSPRRRLLEEENRRLRAELTEVKADRDFWRGRAEQVGGAAAPPAGQGCSEGRLRAVMTSHSSTTAELREAIKATQALLDQASRELAAKQFRERRAAFEQLHQAMDKEDEAALEAALVAARAAEVEPFDIEKAEAKFEALRSMTDEERLAKHQRALAARRRKEAEVLIKKDDEPALRALLDALAEEAPSVRWQDWRDYAGRTMLKCAKELRASRVQRHLEERLGLAPVEDHRPFQRQRSSSSQPEPVEAGAAAQAPPSPPAGPAAAAVGELLAQASSLGERLLAGETAGAAATSQQASGDAATGAVAEDATPASGSSPRRRPGRASGSSSPAAAREEPPEVPPEEEEALRQQAFRAVVQDDCDTLERVLGRVPSAQWRGWENKAGKDMLTLSQERGSTCAYAVLARALGMVHEMKREAYAERESVWVFAQGDVQPRRATVVEDTPEEADDVLIEYWEGDAPPEPVERCMVHKILSP